MKPENAPAAVPKLIVARWSRDNAQVLTSCRFCGAFVGLNLDQYLEARDHPQATIACADCALVLSETLDQLAARTELDFRAFEGKYIQPNEAGQLAEAAAPPPGTSVPIIAAPWELVRQRGTMQAKCRMCAGLVGLAPPSQEMLAAQPETVILCTRCFSALPAIEIERQ